MKIIDYVDIRIAAEPISFKDEMVFEKITDYVLECIQSKRHLRTSTKISKAIHIMNRIIQKNNTCIDEDQLKVRIHQYIRDKLEKAYLEKQQAGNCWKHMSCSCLYKVLFK